MPRGVVARHPFDAHVLQVRSASRNAVRLATNQIISLFRDYGNRFVRTIRANLPRGVVALLDFHTAVSEGTLPFFDEI